MISKINFTDVNPISNRETSLIKKDLYYAIKNKDFILGKNVKRFENNFSKLFYGFWNFGFSIFFLEKIFFENF